MTITSPDLYAVCDEYGVSRSTPFPSGFYGKPGMPTSGAFSLQQCVGLSNVSFTPAGGTVSDDQVAPTNPSVTLSCNQSAVWTFSLPSGVTASIASGASATSVNFSRSLNGTSSFAVSGSASGVTANYTVSLTKEAGGGA